MAFEITKLCMVQKKPQKLSEASKAFSGQIGDLSQAPTITLSKNEVEIGIDILFYFS